MCFKFDWLFKLILKLDGVIEVFVVDGDERGEICWKVDLFVIVCGGDY